ncbi:coiled-coil domain-containing protein 92 [Brienomyrus brachyistius]|uniref:coiled-coil domain-containing protein 92 n=1 Tax=Brienomyrus brachyistius TaxID=42636 RepID=UPI0020B4360A|nr:coiled-coil domain-containing protein 92 [Brienomyrus brachyistius]XP_048859566.1 coiled-coil domain-containing protein 92 [Brienomyrus brachyistius]XP_048859567.1 coiled-coil domain-containing protein 92 [Brienomyrus brachyistius]
MDTGSLARQVESVERSVAFLRREQLLLLHGLHIEILSLQKRCTELTRELNVKPPGRTQAEIQEEEEQLEARCREVEGRLGEQQRTLDDLCTELSHKGALVGALRASLKEKERSFLEELKRRSHRSTALGVELQKQTEVAAYLSFQLHAARQSLHQQQLKLHPRAAERPPPASPSPSTSTRPKRRHRLPAQVRAERARECVPRERVTGPAEPTAMPDPALFLHPRRHRSRQGHRQRREKQGGEQPEDLEDQVTRPSTTASSTATETEAE